MRRVGHNRVGSPFQGLVFVIMMAEGGASLCPGLICSGPFGATRTLGGRHAWATLTARNVLGAPTEARARRRLKCYPHWRWLTCYPDFNVTHGLLPDMVSSGWGRIINITSIVAPMGNFGQANYAVAKGG